MDLSREDYRFIFGRALKRAKILMRPTVILSLLSLIFDLILRKKIVADSREKLARSCDNSVWPNECLRKWERLRFKHYLHNSGLTFGGSSGFHDLLLSLKVHLKRVREVYWSYHEVMGLRIKIFPHSKPIPIFWEVRLASRRHSVHRGILIEV